MKLPQTACIALNGIDPLPEWIQQHGFFWFPCIIPGCEGYYLWIRFNDIEIDILPPPSTESINKKLNVLCDLFDQFFKVLKSEYKIESDRIFFMGFSQVGKIWIVVDIEQGAAVALMLALHFQERIGGVIAISPSCVDSIINFLKTKQLKKKEVDVICTHGVKDTTVPVYKVKQWVTV
jgi:predicted esterase